MKRSGRVHDGDEVVGGLFVFVDMIKHAKIRTGRERGEKREQRTEGRVWKKSTQGQESNAWFLARLV